MLSPDSEGVIPMADAEPTAVSGGEHVASVLNWLFRTRLKTTAEGRQKPYTLREVAQGTGISIGYLSEARRGNIENPSLDKLLLLARFFDISAAVFLEPTPSQYTSYNRAQEAPALSNKEQVVRQIAFRAESFSEVELDMVREMMDMIERWRGDDAAHVPRDRSGSTPDPGVDR